MVKMREGPQGTLLAGFANGSFGLWRIDNGAMLLGGKLHEPAVHLLWHGDKIHVASSLGQVQTVDVAAFHRGYCDLLRDVWNAVPVSWEGGLARLRAPPTDHACSTQGAGHSAARTTLAIR